MNEDNSILLVDRRYEPGQTPQTAQLDASHANAVPVAVQVATMTIDESGLWSTNITCSEVVLLNQQRERESRR